MPFKKKDKHTNNFFDSSSGILPQRTSIDPKVEKNNNKPQLSSTIFHKESLDFNKSRDEKDLIEDSVVKKTLIHKIGHPFKHGGYLILGTASSGLALVSVGGPLLLFGVQAVTLPASLFTDKIFSVNNGVMYGAALLTKGLFKGSANFFKKGVLHCDSTKGLPTFKDSILDENLIGKGIDFYRETYEYRSNFRI